MSCKNVIGVSLVALGMVFTAPAMAANSNSAPAKTGEAATGAETTKFSDAQLSSYAAAYKKVQVLNKQYEQRINGAADPAAKKQVMQLKNIDLEGAVESEGLTTKEYNEIFMASKSDQALAARIATMKTASDTKPGDSKIQ